MRLLVIFIISLILIFYSWLIKNIFNLEKKYFFIIFIIFFICIISLFWWVVLTYISPNFLSENIFRFWAFSSGILFLSFLIIFPFWILKLFYKKNFHKYLKYFIIFLIFFINIFWIFNWFSTEIKTYSIKIEKENYLKWKKIILIADSHYWKIFWEKTAEKLVKNLNSIDAEIVIFAWDLFDWPAINYDEIAKILKKINKPVFYAPWNHEEYWDWNGIFELRENWIIVLLNENKIFNGVNISWVTYSENKNPIIFDKNLKNISVKKENFNILIKHEPTNQEIAFKNNYDLVLSWHTHLWQMWPLNYLVKNIYGEFVYGVVEKNWKYSITTSWVWGWWPPQRLWSRSEIIVIEIR